MTEQEFQTRMRELALNPELRAEDYDQEMAKLIKKFAESNFDRRIN